MSSEGYPSTIRERKGENERFLRVRPGRGKENRAAAPNGTVSYEIWGEFLGPPRSSKVLWEG